MSIAAFLNANFSTRPASAPSYRCTARGQTGVAMTRLFTGFGAEGRADAFRLEHAHFGHTVSIEVVS